MVVLFWSWVFSRSGWVFNSVGKVVSGESFFSNSDQPRLEPELICQTRNEKKNWKMKKKTWKVRKKTRRNAQKKSREWEKRRSLAPGQNTHVSWEHLLRVTREHSVKNGAKYYQNIWATKKIVQKKCPFPPRTDPLWSTWPSVKSFV